MLRLAFMLAILIPGIILSLGDRRRALYLYLWFAFFRPQEWVWMDIRGWHLSLILGIVLVIPALLTAKFPTFGHPISVGILTFLGCALIAQMDAIDQARGWNWIDFFWRLALICLYAITLLKTPRDIMRAIAVVGLSLGFYPAKAGLVSLLGGGAQFFSGLGGAFADNNGYALASVMIAPFFLAIAQNADLAFGDFLPKRVVSVIRIGCYVSIPFCAYTVISTFSRGGFIGLVSTILAYVLLHRRRVVLTFVAALLAVVAMKFMPVPEGYGDRLETIPVEEVTTAANPDEDENASNGLEDTAEGRLHFWRVAVLMAEANPTGVGLRNFEPTYNTYDFLNGRYGRRRAVHSSHFQVLAELGYLGAAVWISLFAYSFWVVFKLRSLSHSPGLASDIARFLHTVPTALAISMFGFLVGGAFLSSALNDLTWVTFAIIASLDRYAAQVRAEVARPVRSPAAFAAEQTLAASAMMRTIPGGRA